MHASQEEIETHARTYHGFLAGVRWVALWAAASIATVILILIRVNILSAFVGGSVVFAVLAQISKRFFLHPPENQP